jgi:hypothetical protein
MPHQKGLLRKKREELEALAAISVRPAPETARLLREGDIEAVAAHYQRIRHWVDLTLGFTLRKCVEAIGNQETWAKLSGDPAKFDALLGQILKGTERCLKLIHRIPDYRPPEQAERDQRLEALREEFPDASWGQLAKKYNARFAKEEGNAINPKLAERALNRLVERRAKQQREIVLRALNAAESSLHTASLTDEEVLPLLPTPEIVLQLLISDK